MQYRVYSGPKGSGEISPITKEQMLYKEFTALDAALSWARHVEQGGRVAEAFVRDEAVPPLNGLEDVDGRCAFERRMGHDVPDLAQFFVGQLLRQIGFNDGKFPDLFVCQVLPAAFCEAFDGIVMGF